MLELSYGMAEEPMPFQLRFVAIADFVSIGWRWAVVCMATRDTLINADVCTRLTCPVSFWYREELKSKGLCCVFRQVSSPGAAAPITTGLLYHTALVGV